MASTTESIATAKAFGATVQRATTSNTTPAITSGTLTSYDVDGYFDAEAAGGIVTPCVVTEYRMEREGIFYTSAFGGGGAHDDFYLAHHILYCPTDGNPAFTVLQPTIVQQLDNYKTALVANPMMTISGVSAMHFPFDEKENPMKYWLKEITWGNTTYHGILIEFPVRLNL